MSRVKSILFHRKNSSNDFILIEHHSIHPESYSESWKKTGSVSKPSLALPRRTGLRIKKKRPGGRAGEGAEEGRRKAIVASVVTVRTMQPRRSATKDPPTVYYRESPIFLPAQNFLPFPQRMLQCLIAVAEITITSNPLQLIQFTTFSIG